MTVNVIEISRFGIAHATDSLITHIDLQGNRVPSAEAGRPKIVKVPKFRGAMSWFGTVKLGDWDALAWLGQQAESATKFERKEVDKFADQLAATLGEEIYRRSYRSPLPRGIGIHFTFFDELKGKEVPELIFITNFQSITTLGAYETQTPVIQALRQTFHTISGNRDENYAAHFGENYRATVDDYLNAVGSLSYQNGDNGLFNISASLAEVSVAQLLLRRALNTTDNLRLIGKKLLLRTEIVAKSQELFCLPEYILVGSPCNNLMIAPNGDYFSDTGLE